MNEPKPLREPEIQDVTARMEIDMLKHHVKVLTETVMSQERDIQRLLRLVGALQ